MAASTTRVQCSSPVRRSERAHLNPGFPRIVLKPSHGTYAFAGIGYSVQVWWPATRVVHIRRSGPCPVRLTGKVINASTMTGTVQLTGVPCSTPAYTYTAKIDPSQTKYIAPNA